MESVSPDIVITCPHCGFESVFHQPHPYHAGLADQGFLYNEQGDCTLTWSLSDRDYTAIVGQKNPWELSEMQRHELEERLLPAPDGTRWLFRNPARCRRCGRQISGPITETVHFLRYDGSVDRDSTRGGGPFKDVLKPRRPSVPWTTRDVWLGVVIAAVIIGATYGLVDLVRVLSLRPNVDLWVAIAPSLLELLFLVPVWWFGVRKRHASLRTLGFTRFRFSAVAAGIGLLLAYYMFNGVYAFLLAQFGLQVQTDLTPVFRELSSPWPLFVAVAIVAPVVEETFFRGFIFAGLRARYDWRWAAAISAALFAAAHLEITFFIPAFILGLLFAYLYQRSNSIVPGMILHFLLNTLAFTLIYLQS